MSNYIMQIDFFGNAVRAETEGNMISLTDLVRAGNAWRASKGMPMKPLQAVVESVGFKEFLDITKSKFPDTEVYKTIGAGNKKRTMAHVILAVYVAEQMSPEFHFEVIRTFIQGKILEFRDLGGTEFKNLNAAIDLFLPGREGKDNRGVYIQTAKLLRAKLMGPDAESGCWDTATTAQIHSRYSMENKLVDYLRMGFVRDWEHLKTLIEKMVA